MGPSAWLSVTLFTGMTRRIGIVSTLRFFFLNLSLLVSQNRNLLTYYSKEITLKELRTVSPLVANCAAVFVKFGEQPQISALIAAFSTTQGKKDLKAAGWGVVDLNTLQIVKVTV